MENVSIWLKDYKNKICPAINQDLETDVLIIGGGITGLSIAEALINTNLEVILIEKNEVAKGVTSRTTGKLTYLQENIYTKLTKNYSLDIAQNYLASQLKAISIVQNNIAKYKIDCDFKKVDSYLFTDKKTEIFKIKQEQELLKKMNIKVEKLCKDDLPLNFIYGIKVENSAVFHPLKYLQALKENCLKNNIRIYENSTLIKVNKCKQNYISFVNNYQIKSKYIVFATHYPYFLQPFLMPLKCYLEKSIIRAYKIEKSANYSAININKPTKSIRYHQSNQNNYCIYLSQSHNLYKNIKGQNPQLENILNKKLVYMWSNKDIITYDSLPFIGALTKNDNTMLIATGYNTWGMTNGVLSGEIIKDIIFQKENSYQKLFSPLRKLKLTKLPVNIVSNIISFSSSKLNPNKKEYSSKVKFYKKDGIPLASYIDKNNNEHIIINRCSHLKCGLTFNEQEKTWDCHCHGSRFDLDGKCIEGPSNYNIKYYK